MEERKQICPEFGTPSQVKKLLETSLSLYKQASLETGGLGRNKNKKKTQPPVNLKPVNNRINLGTDLDSMLVDVHFLATFLPDDIYSVREHTFDVELLHSCKRLVLEWQRYIVRAHRLRHVHADERLMHFEANLDGKPVKWSARHSKLNYVPSNEAERNFFKISLEDVYPKAESIVKATISRIYCYLELPYPPILDPDLETLTAVLVPELSMNANANAFANAVSQDPESCACQNLFRNLKIFLSKEARFGEDLQFVIPAFGGECSWEGERAPFGISDLTITHQIVGQNTQVDTSLSRKYVEAGWILACIHDRVLLPTEDYMVGR